jgi:AcrR family transcriptional regulator
VGTPVKSRRRYDSSRRRAAARARRVAVLDAARALFLRDGFAGTTVVAVAEAAGVSPETVYKSFGGKPGLVEALYREALRGEGPVPAYARSDRLRTKPDPREVVRGWSRLAMEVAPRASTVQLLVRDAALVDPQLRELLEEMDEDRHRRMTENAEYLLAAGHLRPDVAVEWAADVMWAVTAPETYELLVLRRGWTLERFADHVYHSVSGLLRSEPARA